MQAKMLPEADVIKRKSRRKNIKILFNSNIFAQRGCSLYWCLIWNHIAEEIQRRMTVNNELCTIHQVIPTANWYHSLPEHIEQEILHEEVDGILSIGVILSREWIAKHNIPCVTYACFNANEIEYDMQALTYIATNALIEQGCQKIALWVSSFQGIPSNLESNAAFFGFKQAHAEWKRELLPELIKNPYYAPNQTGNVVTSQEQGYRLVMDVFATDHSERPDGIVITDDMMTDGALSALQELDIKIGKGLKIATHGNAHSPTLFGRTNNLTVVEFDAVDVTKAMFALLDKMVVGEELPPFPVQLQPKLRREQSIKLR